MAARTTRPDDWSTAQLNPDSALYPNLIAVATPCDGGIEYVNSLTADTATIVSGTYPDQYGEAAFTFDATSYITGTNVPITVLTVVKDETTTGFTNDRIARHGGWTSTSVNDGWQILRKDASTLMPKVLADNWPSFDVTNAAVQDRVQHLLMGWEGDAASGSRFITLDVNTPTTSYTSTTSFETMDQPASTEDLIIGSTTQSVQLVVVLDGTYGTGARRSFLQNIWQIFLDTELIATEGIPSAEFVAPPVVAPGAATITPSGIVSAETFGTAALTGGTATIAPAGIASAEAFGTASLAGPATQGLAPAAIDSAEGFGSAVLAHVTFSLGCLLREGSDVDLDAWLRVDITPDGTVTSESASTETDHRFTLHYQAGTIAEANAIEDYLTGNEMAEFVFTWDADGADYNCVIAGPVEKNMLQGGEWDLTATLLGRPAA